MEAPRIPLTLDLRRPIRPAGRKTGSWIQGKIFRFIKLENLYNQIRPNGQENSRGEVI